MINVRLVHLLDENKRKALMVIYAEDVAPIGVAWTDLLPEGRAADRWPKVQKDLIERAKKRVRFQPIEAAH